MASSFTSPKPMPSMPGQPLVAPGDGPEDAAAEQRAERGVARARCRRAASATPRPTTMPGRLTSSGMKRWSRSMKVIEQERRREHEGDQRRSGVGPKRDEGEDGERRRWRPRPADSAPRSARRSARQRARSSAQETSGQVVVPGDRRAAARAARARAAPPTRPPGCGRCRRSGSCRCRRRRRSASAGRARPSGPASAGAAACRWTSWSCG